MKRPPEYVEYICLSCGVQGLAKVKTNEYLSVKNGRTFLCPKCAGKALCVERRTVFHIPAAANASKG